MNDSATDRVEGAEVEESKMRLRAYLKCISRLFAASNHFFYRASM